MIKIDSVEARIITPDVGLVTCYTTFVSEADGKQTTGRNCYQDVYQKKKEKWQAVAAHVTLLNFQ